ncbi:3D domain-containing protein, partial [Natribacillus halophilus]
EQEEQQQQEAEQDEQEEQQQQEVEQTEQEETGHASQENEEPAGETFTVEATAYTAGCDGCTGITATGLNLNDNPNKSVIAVDPNVIPLGSTVEVEGYGTAVAGDVGAAIQGEKIDIHVPTQEEAINWGRRDVNVTIVE